MINKIKKIIILLKKKFIFQNLKKCNLIVFDCINDDYFEDLFDNVNYYSLSTRIERINKIYINLDVIKFILVNFLKRKLKQNYLISLIHQLDPKLVITLIDNSEEFSILSKYFNEKIPFYAIQGSNRGDIKLKSDDEVKVYNFNTFFCFGPYEKNFYLKKKINIKNFIFTGPLRPSLALKHIKRERIIIKDNKFDIFLPTELSITSPYNKFTNYSDSCIKLADYTANICSKHKLNLIFSAESFLNTKTFKKENEFYKDVLKTYNIKLTPKTSKYSTYINVLESKLVIGLNTTLLREAFYLKKKVFACNISNYVNANFPIKNISSPEIKDFNQFENHVLKLLEMKTENYFELIKNDLDKVVKFDVDCSSIINQEVKKIINS
tara:strand:- start:177 stop:1316 length:1140 start_codon:yes stop_codon:yes gene_type:complete